MLVDALERRLQHVRERHELRRALAFLREGRGPYEARGPMHEEAVRRGDVLERQLRPREQLELAILLEILRLQHAPRARRLRAHREDVEEIARHELDVGRRRSRTDVLQHAEKVVVALREAHALPERGLLGRMAHARLVHERKMRPHAARVEFAHEVASPREQHAHAGTRGFPLDVRVRVDLRHALRRAPFGLVLRLRLGVVHAAHQKERDGDDVRTHHREFLVRLARAVRQDVAVVEQLEARAHVPAVGERDRAGRLMRNRIPFRPRHRAALAHLLRLPEHLLAAPPDELGEREILRAHANASTNRAAFASTAASSSATSTPRISASLHSISPREGRASARP